MDEQAVGLRCRFSNSCRFASYVKFNTQEGMQTAVLVRDTHELAEHRYIHPQITAEWRPEFGQRVSHRGRSTLGRKPKRPDLF